MQWLSVWLQETNFPYPGPKCQDGRLLRMSRIDKSLCNNYADNNPRNGGTYNEEEGSNHLPLLNEHGDIFQRNLHEDYGEECEAYETPLAERPLAGESEYFYDQYVDYPPTNESIIPTQQEHTSSSTHIEHSNTILNVHKKPTQVTATPISSNIDLNNTILNTNYFKKKPPSPYSSTSSFTFFGYPIPSLSLGRFFGANQRGRKDRGDNGSTAASTTVTTTSEMPATHRMHTGSGKVRMYQPNSAEFEKYLKDKDEPAEDSQYADANGRKRFMEINSDETSSSSENPSSVFKTGFRLPTSVERGGFKPIVPENNGGFMPVHDPSKRRGIIEVVASSSSKIDKTNRLIQNYEKSENSFKHKLIPVTSSTTESTMIQEIESHTYYVTEDSMEETTTYRPITRKSMNTTPKPSTPLNKPFTTTSSTTSTTSSSTTTTTTTKPPNTTPKDSYESELYDDDLEAQSVGMMKPPPLIQTTTSETILLIPPPEELVEQIKRQSWIHTTPKQDSQEDNNYLTTTSTSTTMAPDIKTTTTTVPLPYLPRPGGAARSTITKVYTPQTLNQHLPTAEEYQRTTPSLTSKTFTTEEPQLTANAQKRDEPSIDRKDGMDWYYESFKKTRTSGSTKPVFSDTSSLRSSAVREKSISTTVYLVLICLNILNLQNY